MTIDLFLQRTGRLAHDQEVADTGLITFFQPYKNHQSHIYINIS